MSSYVSGIERYPHLKKRLDYELRRLGNNCSDCEKRKVYDKYREIIRKEDARQESLTKRKGNKP